jgi:hypothetical protein
MSTWGKAAQAIARLFCEGCQSALAADLGTQSQSYAGAVCYSSCMMKYCQEFLHIARQLTGTRPAVVGKSAVYPAWSLFHE